MAKKKRYIKGIDIDPELARLVKELASELGVTESQIYQYFVAAGLVELKRGTSGIFNRLTPSPSINYKYNIDIEDLKRFLLSSDEE